MLTREQRKEAQAAFADVQQTLCRADLTSDERMTLEIHAARLAGLLLSDWFPVGWFRRTSAAVLGGFAVAGPFLGYPHALFLLVLMPAFSPRIVGEIGAFVSRAARAYIGDTRPDLPRQER